MSRDIFNGFYNGRKVLVTGHTGFKGSWLSIWLHSLGAEVIGVAKEPYSDKDNYVLSGLKDKIIDLRGDINDGNLMKEIFR
ncbi:MAG TPA: NAD-dependent epimerase/dehydratase family protein, partial [Candidatus Egerieousia sp.]|nr:NAD-dependent epimerase/dehydratase family protein [Candidatus Egerieousia sp.]